MVTMAPPPGKSPAAAVFNRDFDATAKAVARAVAEDDFDTLIMVLIARPYRTDWFDEFAGRMDDKTYWRLLGELWVDQENPEDFVEEWQVRFASPRPGREEIMQPEEREALAALPDEIEVFRADIGAAPWGPSWTMIEEVARWFAGRYSPEAPATLYRGRVRREDVLAHFTRREEAEIVVARPGLVRDVEEVP